MNNARKRDVAHARPLRGRFVLAPLALLLTGISFAEPPAPAAPPPTPAAPSDPAKATPTPRRPAPVIPLRIPEVTLREWTSTRTEASRKDDARQVTLGRLAFSRVDVHCDDTKVAETLRALADAIGVNISMKFDVSFVDDSPVYLDLTNVDGLAALEAIIAQGGTDATWQLNKGVIEIGSRAYLARQSARRTETYDVSALTHHVHYKAPPEWLQIQPETEPDPELKRKRPPVELAADLIQAIVDQVEIEAWQPLPPGDGTEGTRGPDPRLAPSQGSNHYGMRNQSAQGDRNFDPVIGPPFVRGKWASIAYYQQGGHLIVSAPDFVHRGIAGYPAPLPVAMTR